MTEIYNKLESRKIKIDLNGPQGSALNLVRLAASLGKKLKMSKSKIRSIQDEMILSDYEMLIQTFNKWFGKYVILYR